MNFTLEALSWRVGALHGLLSDCESALGTVLHIHGTGGNFYENPFILPLGEVYTERRLRYAAVNFPGHDADASHENFLDYESALDGWITKLAPRGPVILQGHSLGALKALHYTRKSGTRWGKRVSGLVLLSPFDLVCFYGGRRPEDRRREVEQIGAAEEDLVPKALFPHWPISVKTFLQMTADGGPGDQFPTRKGSGLLDDLRVPTFVALGGDDFASYPSPGEAIESIGSNSVITRLLVKGAPHNFAGKTADLATAVSSWSERLW